MLSVMLWRSSVRRTSEESAGTGTRYRGRFARRGRHASSPFMQTPGLIALHSSHDGAGPTLERRKCALRVAAHIQQGRQVLLGCDGFW